MKNWKSIVGVVVVFILGMLTGILVTAKFVEKRVTRVISGGPSALAEEIMDRLESRLKLDATQRGQAQAIVLEGQRQMKQVRKQVEPQALEILEQSEAKLRAILRPDQLEKFDTLVAKRKEGWEKFAQ